MGSRAVRCKHGGKGAAQRAGPWPRLKGAGKASREEGNS